MNTKLTNEFQQEWYGDIVLPNPSTFKNPSDIPYNWAEKPAAKSKQEQLEAYRRDLIAERIDAHNSKREAAEAMRQHWKWEVQNARRMGVRFYKVGVHTIAYSVDKDVITFATTIKSPKDANNDLYGKFVAAVRYMNGHVAFVRKPKQYDDARDWLIDMFLF